MTSPWQAVVLHLRGIRCLIFEDLLSPKSNWYGDPARMEIYVDERSEGRSVIRFHGEVSPGFSCDGSADYSLLLLLLL